MIKGCSTRKGIPLGTELAVINFSVVKNDTQLFPYATLSHARYPPDMSGGYIMTWSFSYLSHFPSIKNSAGVRV